MLSYLYLSVLLLDWAAAGVVYRDCGSTATIHDLQVTSCVTEPCQFRRNTNVNVTINLTANNDVTAASTVVHGIIAGIPISFPLPNDACKDMPCPFSSGTIVDYTNSIFVQPAYPKIKLVVKWEVKVQDGSDLICFLIPVEITD